MIYSVEHAMGAQIMFVQNQRKRLWIVHSFFTGFSAGETNNRHNFPLKYRKKQNMKYRHFFKYLTKGDKFCSRALAAGITKLSSDDERVRDLSHTLSHAVQNSKSKYRSSIQEECAGRWQRTNPKEANYSRK